MLNPNITLLSLSYVNLYVVYMNSKQKVNKFQNHPRNVVSTVYTYSGFRVIASRILHEICLLLGVQI